MSERESSLLPKQNLSKVTAISLHSSLNLRPPTVVQPFADYWEREREDRQYLVIQRRGVEWFLQVLWYYGGGFTEIWGWFWDGFVEIVGEIWLGVEDWRKLWSLQAGIWLLYATLSASCLTSLAFLFWASLKVSANFFLYLGLFLVSHDSFLSLKNWVCWYLIILFEPVIFFPLSNKTLCLSWAFLCTCYVIVLLIGMFSASISLACLLICLHYP